MRSCVIIEIGGRGGVPGVSPCRDGRKISGKCIYRKLLTERIGIEVLIAAIITITLALVFYTIGVWSEHRSKQLKKIHLIFFWLGLCMDTTGTVLMGQIAEQPMFSGKLSLHGVTGTLAIILMIVHAIWATVVLTRDNKDSAKNFHRLSIAVWAVWLLPYVLGMIIGMR